MRFRDLDIGQTFRFLHRDMAELQICTRTGPGTYTGGIGNGQGYLAKANRSLNVEPIGEPPAPARYEPSLDELAALLEAARLGLRANPSLDRDEVLESILTVLEALVRRS